jgi:hypothetical protein
MWKNKSRGTRPGIQRIVSEMDVRCVPCTSRKMLARLHFVLTAVSLTLGVVLFYASFTYEDEQKRLQSTLEDWWIRLSYAEDAALSKHVAFMQAVAKLGSDLFDRVWGKQLLSLRAFGVSVCFTFASTSIIPLVGVAGGPSPWSFGGAFIYFVAFGGLAFAWGIAPMFIRNRILKGIWFGGIVFILLCMSALFAHLGPKDRSATYTMLQAFTPLLSFLSDLGFVCVTRLVLKRCYQMNRVLRIVGLLFANFVLAMLCIWLPVMIFALVSLKSRNVGWETVGMPVFLLTFSNLADVVVALVFVALAIVMLLHRLIWPALTRPLYALQRVGLIRFRKLLFTSGALLIAYGLGISLQAAQKLLRLAL